jgi:hypothetical protein
MKLNIYIDAQQARKSGITLTEFNAREIKYKNPETRRIVINYQSLTDTNNVNDDNHMFTANSNKSKAIFSGTAAILESSPFFSIVKKFMEENITKDIDDPKALENAEKILRSFKVLS